VEDLGSTNGTYLDQQRVQGPLLITPGQPIRIGQTALELRT
jgi:pSer/pThr/pTyr-binding forkhead associated (FHA) protein